jgi:cytochrome c oxidase subunit I+III
VITSRYPIWDQPNFIKEYDEGKFFLPDAAEELRETLITSTIDARPVQCLRVPGPTFITHFAALFSGGFFIFATYKWWWPAIISGVLGVLSIFTWLWQGTAWIPEKKEKDVGMGKTLPLYISGPNAVGWWAMFITMTADLTAFISLVFGYFFYWTVDKNFPPVDQPELGYQWPLIAAALILLSWIFTWLGRYFNRKDIAPIYYFLLSMAFITGVAGSVALWWSPKSVQMDPTSHVYPAMVWILMGWTALHVLTGNLMQVYCMARRFFNKMTSEYDADITNVTLYWHFIALTTVITIAVTAGFPLLLGKG